MNMTKERTGIVKALPYIILIALSILLPVFLNSRTWINCFIMIFVSIVGSVSLRTISLSGNMSFAHGAFIGLGAYTAGVLAKSFGLSMFITIPLGAIFALLIGLITGWPFSRLRRIYFCMGSMFMGVAIINFISSMKITGGANGMMKIPSMSKALSGLTDLIGWSSTYTCYYFFLLITLISLVCLYRFEHSRIGWTLRALSQSPEVAESIGINEKFYRLLSVGLGCFFAGLAGATYAHYNTTLSPNSYSMNLTLWLIMYMMIGGQSSFLGPIIGAIILELLSQITTLLNGMTGGNVSEGFIAFARWVGTYSAYSPFLLAFILLLIAYFMPGGLISIPASIKMKRAARREAKRKEGDANAA